MGWQGLLAAGPSAQVLSDASLRTCRRGEVHSSVDLNLAQTFTQHDPVGLAQEEGLNHFERHFFLLQHLCESGVCD